MGEVDKESSIIRCRSCWVEVDALELGGSFLNRVCPNCGARLNEDDYDTIAREIRCDVKQMFKRKAELKHKVGSYRKLVATSCLRWLAPMRWLWSSRQAKARAEIDVIDSRLGEAAEELRVLAHDRYYAGEWFQCAHIPLVVRDSQGRLDFELEVTYTEGGSFRLTGKDVTASGYEGEFIVFEALRKRVANPNSPLFGARLLPNLFLPHDGSRSDMKAGRWNQVDCVVATGKGAFVIEVKRWRARVSTISSFSQLYIARTGVDGGMYRPAEHVLRQIERTSQAFEKVSPYLDERVFRVVVFVRPQEFSADFGDFVGQTLVSRCETEGGPFVSAIERKLEGLGWLFEAEEIVPWADDVLLAFGDLDGAYRKQALDRRFRECKHDKTHQRRRKGTRAASARKHQNQKRGNSRKGVNKRKQAKERIDKHEWDW